MGEANRTINIFKIYPPFAIKNAFGVTELKMSSGNPTRLTMSTKAAHHIAENTKLFGLLY